MGVRQMDRGRVLGHLRVRQKQTRGSRDPHVDTGAAMADEGVVVEEEDYKKITRGSCPSSETTPP